jgi:hypothetical protein
VEYEFLWSRIIPMQLGIRRAGYTLRCVPIDRENMESAMRSGWTQFIGQKCNPPCKKETCGVQRIHTLKSTIKRQ